MKGCSPNDKRWSRVIAQYNILNSCITKKKTKWWWRVVQKLLGINDEIKKQEVDDELKEFIFTQLTKRAENSCDYMEDNESRKKRLNCRGDRVLEEKNCLADLKWSIIDAQFANSIFIWHIATELCYYADNMLPKAIGLIGNKSDSAKYLLMNYYNYENKEETYEELLKLREGGGSDILLLSGSKLAYQLQNLKPQNEGNWGHKEKWEMMDQVWMELLTYAACHCGWKEHGQHLRNGGELLTHVCVLMVNLGLGELFVDDKNQNSQV
ncbi:hypothetical protein PTKIN_Ptkin07bG0060100 [Pterospermum kingtungense]